MTYPRTSSFETHGAGAGEAQASPAFITNIGGIKAVTIERKRRQPNMWGLTPILVERKTFEAIFIPVSEHIPIIAG